MKSYSKYLVAIIVELLLTVSGQNSVRAQDIIEIDSSGITINGHYLGVLLEDTNGTVNDKFNVSNIRKILKRPIKKGLKNSSEAIVKNNRSTKFIYDCYYYEIANAPIIHFEQTYAYKKFLTVKILDLVINSNTTYQDIQNSKLFKQMSDDGIDSNIIIKPYSLYFVNILGLNINLLINVSNGPNDEVSNISVSFNDVKKIKHSY